MNLTSLLSQMGYLEKALEYAQTSIRVGLEEKPVNNKYIAIGYHNQATVYEQLNNYEQALTYHKTCFNHCVATLGIHDPLTVKFKKSLSEVKQVTFRVAID